MEIRISCQRCRQKFSASTNAEFVHCPHCSTPNRNRTLYVDHGSSRLSPPPIKGDLVKEKLKKILRGSCQSNPSSSSFASSSSSSSIYISKPRANSNNSSGGGWPNKRALLCGVSYKKWKYKLKGTINDVFNMRDLLIEIYGFRKENIRMLTEDETEAELIPTKANIEKSLEWLVEECRAGDSLVFFYSGHGLRQPDFNNDEIDGYDETICPVDFLKEGMILDNDIYATIVKPLPKDVTLHAIVDACHSGTILDLENVYDTQQKKWIDNRPPSGVRKQTSGGKAYCISACGDDQVAADTTAFNSKMMNGAMTFTFIDVIRRKQSVKERITYGVLLDAIQEQLDKANKQGCLGKSRILRRICGPNLTQKPLLSASEVFDVYQKEFTL